MEITKIVKQLDLFWDIQKKTRREVTKTDASFKHLFLNTVKMSLEIRNAVSDKSLNAKISYNYLPIYK